MIKLVDFYYIFAVLVFLQKLQKNTFDELQYFDKTTLKETTGFGRSYDSCINGIKQPIRNSNVLQSLKLFWYQWKFGRIWFESNG